MECTVSLAQSKTFSVEGFVRSIDLRVLIKERNDQKLSAYAVVHCSTCCRPILDRYVFQIGTYQSYHQHCLKCVDCGQQLNEKCFLKEDQLFCRQDFYK